MLQPHHRRTTFRNRLTLMVILAVLLFLIFADRHSASAEVQQTDTQPPVTLEAGKPLEREMRGGDTHSYLIQATAGHYLLIVVEEHGIELMATLYTPDGKKLYDVDNPSESNPHEQTPLIAAVTGIYKLTVQSAAGDPAGRYVVKIAEARTTPTEMDKSRVAAWQAYSEAQELKEAGKGETLKKGLEKFAESLPFWRAISDRPMEATTLNKMGVIFYSLGDMPKAFDHYQQALTLDRALGDNEGQAACLNNIGAVFAEISDYRQAIDFYRQALPIWQKIGDKDGAAATLSNIGQMYNETGEKQQAIAYLNQSLAIRRTINDAPGLAATLINLGAFYNSSGEKQQALDALNEALAITRTLPDQRREAMALNNLGRVYRELGAMEQALAYYQQALPLRRAVSDPGGEAATLGNIGAVYQYQANYPKAIDYYQQSLAIRRATRNPLGEATNLHNLGVVYYKMQDYGKALEHLQEALAIRRRIGDREGQAFALYNLANVYYSLPDKAQALAFCKEALTLRQAIGDRAGEGFALRCIARGERDLGDFTAARRHSDEAMQRVEAVRASVNSQELRASYLASALDFYEFHINLLMQQHKQQPGSELVAEALQTSERARARSLLELLNEARTDIRQGVDPKLLDRERELQQQITDKESKKIQLLNGKSTPDKQTAIAKLAKEIEEDASQYKEVQAKIRAASPGYAALTQPQPIKLEEIQRLLDPDTLLLEYALGDVSSYLWAVTPTTITGFELPKRAEVEAAATRVYQLLTARECRAKGKTQKQWEERIRQADWAYPKAAADLSQMILAPVANQLDKKRLLIVADGALHYIPFAALPAPVSQESRVGSRESKPRGYLAPKGLRPEQTSKLPSKDSRLLTPDSRLPLMIEHEIINLPSASTLARLRSDTANRPPAPKTIAIFANPVFRFDKDDPRFQRLARPAAKASDDKVPAVDSGNVKRSLSALMDKACAVEGTTEELMIEGLGGSEREAKVIRQLVPASMCRLALGFDVNYETVTSADLQNYRIVHFATHGILNSKQPELSGILLSLVDQQGEEKKNGLLRLGEIYNLSLSADLVVLSACQTALGQEVRGEGLIGLTRGFMYAGAQRVVASLWRVEDETTSRLMKKFYEGMLKQNLRPAAALRQAQMFIWQGANTKGKNAARTGSQATAPFYWSAFTLQGEWQ